MSKTKEWVAGTVKNWFEEQAYGFVKIDDMPDAFLHITIIPKDLREQVEVGTAVEVLLSEGQKGPRVMKMRLI